jgi:hypothetical protein
MDDENVMEIDEETEEEIQEEKEPQLIMECPASCAFYEHGDAASRGSAVIRLDEENLHIFPKMGDGLTLAFRDILEVTIGDYRVYLTLGSGQGLEIYDLGFKFENFLKNLSRLRNEALIKDMLMNEKMVKPGVEAECIHYGENMEELYRGQCELRVYETAVIIIPLFRDPERMPFSFIASVSEEDYAVGITMEHGEKYLFYKMGRELDPFKRAVYDSSNKLAQKAQSYIRELFPAVDLSSARRAAVFMKDGRAASKAAIDSISPRLWAQMEQKLKDSGADEEYNFLKSIGSRDRLCIGIKRGLMGELTGDYIWFLVPVFSIGGAGNAVAMEAVSPDGGSRATYFFRIADRGEYAHFTKEEDFYLMADRFISRLNYCMLAINFRREPIYLSDSALEKPQYTKYRYSIQKLPQLRTLRELFIGRVIHSSADQWKKDVEDLLKFNVSTTDSSLKWKKGKSLDE